MKFITSALLLLLPFTAIAAPAPDSAESRSVAQSGEEIFDKRAEELCSIINVSTYVNCRSGPGTGYSVVTTLKEGEKSYYSCYEPGTCTDGNCAARGLILDIIAPGTGMKTMDATLTVITLQQIAPRYAVI
ncbi:hypothetical protein ZTR_08970 [Talaromyces verruculosus]|nr:hypothetical protein ZTR_08970 [Talaromyces verruculosus]